MNQILENITVGEIVAKDYRAAEVFKKHGIDFCCGGKKSVADVCAQKGLNPALIDMDLSALSQDAPSQNAVAADTWPLGLLCDYIVQIHHTYTREKLPLLMEYATKVAKVHGHAWPENIEIAVLTRALQEEMTDHMRKEEEILFPYIKAIAGHNASDGRVGKPAFGTVANPIAVMESEHESAGDAIKEIRRLSHNFTPPEGACNTYRVLYKLLEEFESDLHKHVHLENNILFPRAVAMEKQIA
jgi:regulator of cell morphogenesis and NO signaling